MDAQGNGNLRLGNRPLIGPVTDPTTYYPPQAGPSESEDALGQSKFSEESFWSGFGYPARNARVEGERIRFESSSLEIFSSYCALQTPYATSAPSASTTGYACLPYCFDMNVNNAGDGKCIIPATTSNTGWTRGEPIVEVACAQLAIPKAGQQILADNRLGLC